MPTNNTGEPLLVGPDANGNYLLVPVGGTYTSPSAPPTTQQGIPLPPATPPPPDGYVPFIQGGVVSWQPYHASEALYDLGSVSGALNVDLNLAPAYKMVLTGNAVLTFINPKQGSNISYVTLMVTQDATGGRTLDITGRAGSQGANALANLSATSGAVDIVSCTSWDNGSHWMTAVTASGVA